MYQIHGPIRWLHTWAILIKIDNVALKTREN